MQVRMLSLLCPEVMKCQSEHVIHTYPIVPNLLQQEHLMKAHNMVVISLSKKTKTRINLLQSTAYTQFLKKDDISSTNNLKVSSDLIYCPGSQGC